jgi:hypothetical protein
MARWSSSIHWNFIGAPKGSGSIASRPLRDPRRAMRLQTAATNVVRIAASRSQSHLYRGPCPDASLSIIGCARRVRLVGPVAFSRCWSKKRKSNGPLAVHCFPRGILQHRRVLPAEQIMASDASSCSKAAAGPAPSASNFGSGPRAQRTSDAGRFVLLEPFRCHRSRRCSERSEPENW